LTELTLGIPSFLNTSTTNVSMVNMVILITALTRVTSLLCSSECARNISMWGHLLLNKGTNKLKSG